VVKRELIVEKPKINVRNVIKQQRRNNKYYILLLYTMDLLCIDDIILNCDWVEVGDNGEEISPQIDSDNTKYIDGSNDVAAYVRYGIVLPSMDDSYDAHDRNIMEHIMCNGCTTLLYDDEGDRITIY